MTISAITSEFNPFHRGHLLPLTYSKDVLGADITIAVMSGNYVQRGEPAIISKEKRTLAALSAGYDMVLQIPVTGIIRSASDYAESAISLMAKSNIITHFVFGAEKADQSLFDIISSILKDEPESYKRSLKGHLKTGQTYAKARSLALIDYTSKNELKDFLSGSNNILGIEYCLAAKNIKDSLIPVPIQRTGGDYHSTGLSLSAESIRNALYDLNGNNASEEEKSGLFDRFSDYMPQASLNILRESISAGEILSWQDFNLLLLNKLTLYFRENDCLDDLDKRIKNNLPEYTDSKTFIELIKTKNITYTSVSRRLLQILLDYPTASNRNNTLLDNEASYIRVLGFREESKDLLSLLKEKSKVPLIINPAKDMESLSAPAKAKFAFDLAASDLYRQALISKTHHPYPTELSYKYPIKATTN